MLLICPRCQAENEDVARFCNQCGAALGNSLPENRTEPAVQVEHAVSAPSSATNWTGLIIIAVVILAIWYMVGSKPKTTEQGMAAGDAAPMMEQILEQVADLKGRHAKDPGNVEIISEMYQLYGQVGKTAEVTPYTRESLDHLVANTDSLDETTLGDTLLALFIAAYENRDDAICLEILEAYHVKFPDNIRILKVLGDMSYDNLLFDQAIIYYEKYLAAQEHEADPENYLNAMTDLGSCYIQMNELGDAESRSDAQLEFALAKFDEVLAMDPDFWQAHFNRGVAFGKLERQAEAVTEWEWCRDNTDSAMEAWRAEYAIAELTGADLPPMPGNPHGEGFTGMGSAGGMANPHAEGGMANPHAEGGMGNPHGEAAPPLDGNNLPPNPHSEEFLKENSGDAGSGTATDD